MNIENIDPTVLKRGVLLALERDDAKRLFGARGDEALCEFLSGFVAEPSVWSGETAVDCLGQWETIHQILKARQDATPLDQCILGGRPLYQGSEMTVCLVRPDLVPHLANGLDEIEEAGFRDQIPAPQDVAEAYAAFLRVRQLYRSASEQGQAIVFAVEH